MRVERYFAFVDLSGFTAFTDSHGDEQAVEVLTRFRAAVREVATEHGVRVAKWLGDGCMFVSTDPEALVAAVLALEQRVDDTGLPLRLHAGIAGGPVILVEGDDYTGQPVNLASRLCSEAGPHQILATPDLAALAPPGTIIEPVPTLRVRGLSEPVDAVRLANPAADDAAAADAAR